MTTLDQRNDLHYGRVEAALNSGTVEQRLQKLALMVAHMAGDWTAQDLARIAEHAERVVHYEREDPRA
jgi:hypothetical protein